MKKENQTFEEFYADHIFEASDPHEGHLGDDQICKIASNFFGKIAYLLFPEVKLDSGCIPDISKDLVTNYGFTGIKHEYRVSEDKESVYFSHYSILVNEEKEAIALLYSGISNVVQIIGTNTWLSFNTEVYNQLLNKYKISVKPGKVVNFFYLEYRKMKDTLHLIPDTFVNEQNPKIPAHYKFNEVVQKFIKSAKSSGGFIFYGDPGTGKSKYIVYLAQTNPDITFASADMTTLCTEVGYARLEKFIRSYLMKTEGNLVLVMEDCEKALFSPGGDRSPLVSKILNIIDGVSKFDGRVKFIFTLNNMKNIDKAIERRLYQKPIKFDRFTGEELIEMASYFGVTLKEERLLKRGLSISDIVRLSEGMIEESDLLKEDGRISGFSA